MNASKVEASPVDSGKDTLTVELRESGGSHVKLGDEFFTWTKRGRTADDVALVHTLTHTDLDDTPHNLQNIYLSI
ncbi:unnamed protein product [Danaus chrysippus]|uniref:(African queen) hypothetical protein n=1 Tax=Danaus chrysippus TaxID=151541 RepID=A0A8J2W0Q9_9NEOP|nr:unnamed protein product [Danaus chrysippus]